MTQNKPMVSCLLPAGNNFGGIARSILCYQEQSWPNKQLVVINYGDEDLAPLLDEIPSDELRYIHHQQDGVFSMATALNRGLDHADGSYVAYWSETDWYHPERIRCQLEAMNSGEDFSLLDGVIVHLDHPEYVHHPYIQDKSGGYAESLLVRYFPELRFPVKGKNPLRSVMKNVPEQQISKLDTSFAWLMVHGLEGEAGSKPYKAFLAGLRNSPKSLVWTGWLKMRGRNLANHPRFKLSSEARSSFYLYLRESQKLGLIASLSE